MCSLIGQNEGCGIQSNILSFPHLPTRSAMYPSAMYPLIYIYVQVGKLGRLLAQIPLVTHKASMAAGVNSGAELLKRTAQATRQAVCASHFAHQLSPRHSG